jgi:hypothetical protein
MLFLVILSKTLHKLHDLGFSSGYELPLAIVLHESKRMGPQATQAAAESSDPRAPQPPSAIFFLTPRDSKWISLFYS